MHWRPASRLGVAIVFAPTIAPFVVVAAILVRAPRPAAALVVAALVPVVPVAVRNYQHGREVVVVSTNGGLNLFIGNNAALRRHVRDAAPAATGKS